MTVDMITIKWHLIDQNVAQRAHHQKRLRIGALGHMAG